MHCLSESFRKCLANVVFRHALLSGKRLLEPKTLAIYSLVNTPVLEIRSASIFLTLEVVLLTFPMELCFRVTGRCIASLLHLKSVRDSLYTNVYLVSAIAFACLISALPYRLELSHCPELHSSFIPMAYCR